MSPCTSNGIPIVSGPSVGVPVVSGEGPIAVLPLGALTGDGTICHPLGVIVDGVTVVINGSNQLAAVGGGYFTATAAGTFGGGVAGPSGFLVPIHTQLGIIAGIPNAVIAPLKFYFTAHQNDNLGVPDNAVWSPETGVEVIYNGVTAPAFFTSGVDLLYLAVGAHDGTSLGEPVNLSNNTNTLNAYAGKDVIVRTANVIDAVSTANKFITNKWRWSMSYVVIPATII